jgi:Fe-S-cluster containining protein
MSTPPGEGAHASRLQSCMTEADDLIRIADSALADSYARAGDWMTCRVGCTQCCVGVFPITQLDAERLRQGFVTAPPEIRRSLAARITASVSRLAPGFPGDAGTGSLGKTDEQAAAFEDFGNDEVCPVLDPETGACSLYAARPIPCRSFGPPLRNDEDGLAVCELCFVGAPEEEIARCEVDPGFQRLEAELVEQNEREGGPAGTTLIAFALREPALREAAARDSGMPPFALRDRATADVVPDRLPRHDNVPHAPDR